MRYPCSIMQYTTERSERKKLTLFIERDNRLIIRAPKESTDEEVSLFFGRKRLWLYQKLAQKKYMQFTDVSKEYVNWEGFLYLGRSYRLKIVDNPSVPLRLWRWYFELDRKKIKDWQKVLIERYKQKTTIRIQKRLALYEKKLGKRAVWWWVKDLKYRRGSCTTADKIYFHRKIALAPTDVQDYIIAHELVHIVEKKHTKRFWDLLGLVFPWYEKQKEWLKINGGELVL